MKKGKILVVDDNANIRSALELLLPAYFAEVELLPSPAGLLTAVQKFRPDAVLLDMNFHTDTNTGGEGLYWTGELKKAYPHVQIVLFTAYADIALAVEGMKRGAFDFIVKPWENDKLIQTLRDACEAYSQPLPKGEGTMNGSNQPSLLQEGTGEASGEAPMFWGSSAAMAEIRRTVAKVAPTDATILITGENGTGKDVLAREIHAQSLRSAGPMVSVDAGAIPETLFEGELFGHVKGAFTDARSDHAGKFEQASGGTLFLDEIANIPLTLQAKLLRVLQSRTVTRVGAEAPVPVDIRLICATNGNIEQMVGEGRFREDLYFRINTVRLHLPPLRERPDDILPLARRFLRVYAQRYHRAVTAISDEAATALRHHPWNGNIRELQNTIEKAVILSEGSTLQVGDFRLQRPATNDKNPAADSLTIKESEEQLIRDAIVRLNGNLSLVARELGISRPTLYSKLKKYDI
ncbi:MAG: sigma-54-dependent Fis family transcriptional regulator [Bacteroidales bacterium]|nr:sigma-54-dependent Fis family transcriptional regulator [Bacteroidales bacterium]MBR4336727.1 sigma-54-dependent Fis family transcriptional regulator [Bacteroidaceae bacterium]